MLRIKCPACLHNVELPEPQDEGPLTCPDCQARFDLTGRLIPVTPAPLRHMPVAPISRRGALAQFAMDPEEYDEQRLERKERRQERREIREFRREDRYDIREERKENKEKNNMAIVGFAIGLCALVVALSGIVVADSMKVYFGFCLAMAFPGAVMGMIFSLIGLFTRKVMRPLAGVGLGISMILLILIVPLGAKAVFK
jgi:hypothetical protein